MNANDPKPNPTLDRIDEPSERWGTWEDAEHWRKESFMRRTPAQRLQWLEEMMDFARIGKQQGRDRSSE